MRMRYWYLAASLLAVPAVAQGGDKAPAAQRAGVRDVEAMSLLRRADALEREQKIVEAAPLLQQAAERLGDDWALWDRAGWAHLDSGKPDLAYAAFTRARATAPRSRNMVGGLMASGYLLGKKDEVLALVTQRIDADDVAEARAVVEKGLAAPKESPDWNYGLAYLYARVMQDANRALDFAEAVAMAEPKRADAWLLLVEINRSLSRREHEDAAAAEFVELASESEAAFRLIAERLTELRQYPEAIAQYQAGMEKHPTAAALYYGQARVHERLRDAKSAQETYERLIRVATEKKRERLANQARAQLAQFHVRQRNWEPAETYYRDAVKAPDATWFTWQMWGSLLALRGQWEPAADAIDHSAALRGKDADPRDPASVDEVFAGRYRAAVYRLAAGDREKAQAALVEALKSTGGEQSQATAEAAAFLAWLNPDTKVPPYQRGDERWAPFSWPRERSGDTFALRDDNSASGTAWRAVLQHLQQQSPDCWPAHYALARIYATAGYSDEGLGLLSRVTEMRRDWWAPFYALGLYHMRYGSNPAAIAAFTRVVELAPECRNARVYLSMLRQAPPDDPDEP